MRVTCSFSVQQDQLSSSLEAYIEASVMLQYNSRNITYYIVYVPENMRPLYSCTLTEAGGRGLQCHKNTENNGKLLEHNGSIT